MLLGHRDASRASKGVQMSDTEANRYEMVLEATGEIDRKWKIKAMEARNDG